MKILVFVMLLFCVGCGPVEVSEQEKLAKRMNEKMDQDEAEKERKEARKIKWNEETDEMIKKMKKNWKKLDEDRAKLKAKN